MESSQETARRRMTKGTLTFYILSFIATLAVAVIGYSNGDAGDLILIVPVLIIIAFTIFKDRDFVHIPPSYIFMLVLTFYLTTAGKLVQEEGSVRILASAFTGVNLALLGIIVVHILMKRDPSENDDNHMLTVMTTLAVAVATFTIMSMLQHYLSIVDHHITDITIVGFMDSLCFMLLGAIIVCILYSNRYTRRVFSHVIDRFFERNSDRLGLEEKSKSEILKLIDEGESDHLEFKSTLRTNLQTGENDKRMEKAVLKTIVAFLNSNGGDLMVGVSDDGSICGIDIHSFENKDKLNLHFTNMLSSSIGNEYLPYISFNLVDFDEERSVMRVRCERCRKPVFLKEGKNELFYVRSGPSSVELTGVNLINYVRNRSKKSRKMVLEKVLPDE
ncbi:MAG: ATP-binding protein [Candidatus Methanomethylophilaceae archaeon]|nr:ATP-binding protein [Candidatus Methanomethylophilaceae archaeon]